MTLRRSTTGLLLLAAAALTLAGCLEARTVRDVAYDAKTDSFRVLKVWYHISGGNDAERAYLTSLYANRQRLVPADMVPIFGESAFLVDGKECVTLSLGEAGPRAPKRPAPLDMSKIVNKPGKFFMTAQQTLGYYHQFDVPGTEVDALLTWANAAAGQALLGAITAEQARRNDGGAPVTWAVAREQVMQLLPGKRPEAAKPPEGTTPLSVLTDDSLALLKKAIADKTWGASRKAGTFTVRLPASAADRKELMALHGEVVEAIRKAAGEAAAKPDIVASAKALAAIKLVNDDAAGEVRATFEFDELRKALSGVDMIFGDASAEPNAGKVAAMTATLETVRAAKAPIDEKITIDDIRDQFIKGTLATNPAAAGEARDEGLFSTRKDESAPPAVPPQ